MFTYIFAVSLYQQNNQIILTIMKNLLSQLQDKFSKEIKSFGITEIFFIDGEMYTTSKYTLPFELMEEIEKEALSL